MPKPVSDPQVYSLLVEVGRKPDDDLPKKATGAALLCFASGRSEDEAVRESVSVLKQAGLAPLDVTSYGTLDERRAMGHEIGQDELDLMDRALSENAVIVVETRVFFGED